MKKSLRSGYTTGACAAAAAKGASLMLAHQEIVTDVSIKLPTGASALFLLHGQEFTKENATCFVIKDAGDDPDITNGAEVWATASVANGKGQAATLIIEGGAGIGKVTKPGLAIPPGEWAINPVPRKMIEESVGNIPATFNLPLTITISVPDGEERAKKTLNSRLGIIGGLSILGTTGIVRPVSAKAWTDTIDAALDVAKACGCKTVVLSTGRSSEMSAQSHLTHLPDEAYVMMGDHVAHALHACYKRGFDQPVIACQFAKLLKIACGYKNTHAAVSELDLDILHQWACSAGLSSSITDNIAKANTAREVAIANAFDPALIELVVHRAKKAAVEHVHGIKVQPLLCRYDGDVIETADKSD